MNDYERAYQMGLDGAHRCQTRHATSDTLEQEHAWLRQQLAAVTQERERAEQALRMKDGYGSLFARVAFLMSQLAERDQEITRLKALLDIADQTG